MSLPGECVKNEARLEDTRTLKRIRQRTYVKRIFQKIEYAYDTFRTLNVKLNLPRHPKCVFNRLLQCNYTR